MHQHHLEGWLKHRLLDPTLRVSNSAGLGWAWESTLLKSSQVMLMLLVWGPHSENHCLKKSIHQRARARNTFSDLSIHTGFPYSGWFQSHATLFTCPIFIIFKYTLSKRLISTKQLSFWWFSPPVFHFPSSSTLWWKKHWNARPKI